LSYDDLLTTDNDELVALLDSLANGDIQSIYDLLEADYEGIIEDWNDSLEVLQDHLGLDNGET